MVIVAMAVLEGSLETCVRETVLITVIMLYVRGQMDPVHKDVQLEGMVHIVIEAVRTVRTMFV